MTSASSRRRSRAWRSALAAPLILVGVAPAPTSALAAAPDATPASSTCQLQQGAVKHVVFLQFDNVHLRRDEPNVPSDLEQMPNLLNFMKDNGVLLSNHHTPLIAHTAVDILTSETGLYGDRMGVPVGNSYQYFNPSGTPTSRSTSSFAYWTDRIGDGSYEMVTGGGANTPAPWVPYTRAGCDFGGVGTANSVLESTSDVPRVFPPGSDAVNEVNAHSSAAFPDFVGIGIHCAQGSSACGPSSGAVADQLPGEPGGYSGYKALFGNKYVQPAIHPGGPVTDLDGNPVVNSFGGVTNPGFPGFDAMSASVSLAYVADMLEHNVPVTYAYLAVTHKDAHGNDAGAGDPDAVAHLRAYDRAFGQFFTRLSNEGIDSSNTLFMVAADENDHFAGGAPSPAGCDGVNVPCSYPKIGEAQADLPVLMRQAGVTTPFTMHSDSAPNLYLKGNPGPADPVTRNFEKAMAGIQVTNPISGTQEQMVNYVADRTEMQLLHMISPDAARNPTFTAFAKPDYFVQSGPTTCPTDPVAECPGFAWVHGDLSPDINQTWLGVVGPGVAQLGLNDDIWSDHADIRPTQLMLAGLTDDYSHQGRALFEIVQRDALPKSLKQHREWLLRLAQAYKQVNAPVGQFGLASVSLATTAVTGDDATFTQLESDLTSLGSRRDALVNDISAVLEGATFAGQDTDEQQLKSLTDQADALLQELDALGQTYSAGGAG